MMCIRIKFVLFILTCFISSCASPIDDYTPDTETKQVSIAYIKTLYKNAPLEITDDISIIANVISSDRYGNFRNSLVIEDQTGGLEIKIGSGNIFKLFSFGDQVLVRCSGLVLGSYGGALQIGAKSEDDRYECGFIAESEIAGHIKKVNSTPAEPSSTVFTTNNFSTRNINCNVLLKNIQFADYEAGMTWGNDDDQYTERVLEWNNGMQTTVSISPNATFRNSPLPSGRGMIGGVLKFFGNRYYLVVVNDSYCLMDQPRFE